jgi:transposase-like protein
MATIARKSDGRRIFTDKFKREQIGRVRRGELTLAELSRKMGIARSLLQRWKRLMPERAEAASSTRTRVTPASELQAGEYIRELQLLVGKQTVELELLRAELDALKNGARNGRRYRGPSRP